MSEPRARKSLDGELLCNQLRPGVIETRYLGHLTVKLIEDTRPKFKQLLEDSRVTHWLADTLGITSFEPKIGLAGAPWIGDFKSRGGEVLVLVAASAALRMVGTTAGFATGLPIKTFATRAEALAFIENAVRQRDRAS